MFKRSNGDGSYPAAVLIAIVSVILATLAAVVFLTWTGQPWMVTIAGFQLLFAALGSFIYRIFIRKARG
jgi:hypothetical protein